ncbi:unnamed protein product [Amaranthus hypochondriacus]
MLEREAVRRFEAGSRIRRVRHASNGRQHVSRGNFYGVPCSNDAATVTTGQAAQVNGENEHGDWQIVKRRRGPKPSRNNQDHRHGLRSAPDALAGHRGLSRRRWWRGPREPPRLRHGVVSLFVDGIAKSVSMVELRHLFEKEGHVADIYLSGKKRRQLSKGFGFVRFTNIRDAEEAVKKLDNFNLHGCRLKVSKAKYQKGGQSFIVPEVVKQKPKEMVMRPGSPAFRDHRKYKEVVRGTRREVPLATGNDKTTNEVEKEATRRNCTKTIKVIDDPSLKEKLMRAVVIELDEPMDPKRMAARLEDTNIPINYMSYLTPSKFMLFFEDENELADALDENSQLRSRFANVRRWTENENVNSRFAWLECSGINPKVWCLEYIQEIGEQWGKTIHIDHDFYGVNCLTNAKMMIETTVMKKIDEQIRLEWNGGFCDVWVREVAECQCKGKNVLEEWSDTDDDMVDEAIEGSMQGQVHENRIEHNQVKKGISEVHGAVEFCVEQQRADDEGDPLQQDRESADKLMQLIINEMQQVVEENTEMQWEGLENNVQGVVGKNDECGVVQEVEEVEGTNEMQRDLQAIAMQGVVDNTEVQRDVSNQIHEHHAIEEQGEKVQSLSAHSENLWDHFHEQQVFAEAATVRYGSCPVSIDCCPRFDPMISIECSLNSTKVDNHAAVNRGCVGSSSKKVKETKSRKPRGRPKRVAYSLPDPIFVPSTPSISSDEAIETWNVAKSLGINAVNEGAVISELRKSKRLLATGKNNLVLG